MLWSSISTLLLHIPLCWLMVFKTSLGYTGAALAISISYWLNVFMLATYIRFSKSCKETRSPPTIEAFRGVGLFLRLALPSALMLWSFTFARLYSSVDADIAQCVEKAESAKQEKNRAAVVALNAEIRRTKAKLLEEDLPKLQRLALKKVKGLTKEELSARSDLVAALPDRIQSIPDGSTTATKKNGTWGASGSRTGGTIKFDSTSDGNFDDEYFKGTEESNQFRQEYEMRKMKQDEGLDTIGEGLATLKNMASDMNEELDRQVPLIDEMEDKVDRANADSKNTNVRLKETFLQLRSSCNFCIDIVLLCVILGIAAYLYNVLKK